MEKKKKVLFPTAKEKLKILDKMHNDEKVLKKYLKENGVDTEPEIAYRCILALNSIRAKRNFILSIPTHKEEI